jgi:hypothetical protein
VSVLEPDPDFPLLMAEDISRTQVVVEELLADYSSFCGHDTLHYSARIYAAGTFALVFGYLAECSIAGLPCTVSEAIYRTGSWPLIERFYRTQEAPIPMRPGDAGIIREIMDSVFLRIMQSSVEFRTPEEMIELAEVAV